MPVQILTQHNNNARTGVNNVETALTVKAVQDHFHKLFEVPVDPPQAGGPGNWASQIVAQPLFVSDLHLPHLRLLTGVCMFLHTTETLWSTVWRRP